MRSSTSTSRRCATAHGAITGIIRQYIRPEFGALKLPELDKAAINALHRKVAALHPYRANRLVSVLQSMLTFAIKRGDLTGENVAYGVDRAEEQPRQRYLSEDEIARFVAVLDAHPERVSANAIKLLLLTGARRTEVLSATWDQFDLAARHLDQTPHGDQATAHAPRAAVAAGRGIAGGDAA